MGIFDIFGKPKPTKYHVGARVASFIEFVIDDSGIDVLGARSIALDRNFNIHLGGGTESRGGDILAAVQPKGLEGFAELQELLSDGDELMRQLLMADVGSAFVDQISYAVMDEFERQAPEFKRLDTGSPLG